MIQKQKPFLRMSIACVFLLTAGACCILFPFCGNNLPEVTRDLCFILSPVLGGILIMEYALFCCEISVHIHRTLKEIFYPINKLINDKGVFIGKSLYRGGFIQ